MGACLVKPENGLKTAAAVAPYSSPPAKKAPSLPPPPAPRIRLFGAELCPFTCRIRIALQFKLIPYQTIWLTTEDLKSNRQLELLNIINPEAISNAKLPIMQDEQECIGGSSDALLEHIEASFPDPPLVPRSGHGSKKVLDMVAFIRDTFTPLIGQLLYDGDPYVQREITPQLYDSFDKLNDWIKEYSSNSSSTASGGFLFGNSFTLADVYLIPFLFMTRFLEYHRGISIGASRPHLLSYSQRMHMFPCYAPVRINTDLMVISVAKTLVERPPPPLVSITILHHRSILHHLEELISTAEDLAGAKPTGRIVANPAKGSIGMQIRKLSNNYGRLLVLMQEHAQMEERVIFPALERAERGVTKSATEHHAKVLPMINGVREYMKVALALEQGTRDRTDALVALTARLQALQESTVKHFEEEENEILCLLDAADVRMRQQTALIASCVEIMEQSHGPIFPYLLAGLQTHEIQQYVAIMHRCLEKEKPNILKQMVTTCISSEEDFSFVWKAVHERNFATVSQFSDMVVKGVPVKGFY